MATNFPSSLDNFTNPVSGNTLDSPSHSLQHSDANDAIEAIETKLGVGASPAGSATAGQVLTISAAGTSGWSTPTAPALVQIVPSSVSVGSGSGSVGATGAVTFTGVSSISIEGVFSSTYENYAIYGDITSSTGTFIGMRYRVSGSDRTSGYLGSSYYLALSAASFAKDVNVTTYAGLTYCATTDSTFESTLFRPFSTAKTYQISTAIRGDAYLTKLGSYTDTTTSYTGCTIYPVAGGTISGTVRIYGLRN